MDERDIDSQIDDRKGGGATIKVMDGRVTKALGWFWGVVGMAVAGGIWLAASNLYALNVAVTRMADNNSAVAETLKDHEIRLRQVERDVSTWAGRNLRDGPPDPDEVSKPAVRR